jgi:hypothetical protein
VSELAVDGIPVAVTCRVLKLARQPYYRWLAAPVTAREVDEAYLANVLFDAAINSRLRKVLGWKTPAEVLDEQLRSLQQASVATTG